MCAYFVPTRFVWRFGGHQVSIQKRCKLWAGCRRSVLGHASIRSTQQIEALASWLEPFG